MADNFEKLNNGRYITEGLNQRQFIKVFETIRKEQNKARKRAFRTLTPAMLRRKSAADLAKLGKKEDGTEFTREDLLALEKRRKAFQKRYDNKTAGITYAQIIAGSREIDIKRANNQVSDGSGITQASIALIQSNIVAFRVKASAKNGYTHHMVRLRFEEWDDALADAHPDKGYRKAAAAALKGRISIACDCGRHQFWYRYLSTIGNYCLAPPKEFSPPKIRNPDFSGVACKHVLHVLNKSKSAAFMMRYESAMAAQAAKVGFGDSRKIIIDEKAARKMDNAKQAPIDQSRAIAEFAKYQQRQEALAKKLSTSNEKIQAARAAASKARKRLADAERRADAAEASANKAKEVAQVATQQNRDLARQLYQVFKDVNVGKPDAEVRAIAAQRVGMTIEQFNSIIN